jgi:CheY-like chemotaxis protein
MLTITATKEIRALGYTAPIFGVTGNSLPSDVAHFKLHGADVVLIKPLDIDNFKRSMQGMIAVASFMSYF